MNRRTALTRAAMLALALGCGFFAWQDLMGEKIQLDDMRICGTADYAQQAAMFERVLPDRGSLSSDASTRYSLDDDYWFSRCLLTVDDDSALAIQSKLVVGADQDLWRKNLWSREINEGIQLKQLDIGTRALSTPNSFALLVTCTKKDDEGDPLSLNIAVTAQGEARSEDGAHRQDIADIGTKVARLAALETQCKPAKPLPESAPPIK